MERKKTGIEIKCSYKKRLIEILKNYQIDGIECMHSEFNDEQIEYLLKLTKERKYLRSGRKRLSWKK